MSWISLARSSSLRNPTGISPSTDSPINPICIRAGGRDVPNGTLNKYVKELGFRNLSEFRRFLNTL